MMKRSTRSARDAREAGVGGDDQSFGGAPVVTRRLFAREGGDHQRERGARRGRKETFGPRPILFCAGVKGRWPSRVGRAEPESQELRRMRFRLALVLAALLLAAGCRPSPPADDALILRIYEVPKGTARPVLQTMKEAFYFDDTKKNVGRASLTPDGRIAVLAPANMQVGVRDLVEGVEKSPPKAEQTIELHYFVVDRHPERVGSAAARRRHRDPARARRDRPLPGAAEVHAGAAHRARRAAATRRAASNGEELEIRQRCSQTSDGVYAMLTVRYGRRQARDPRAARQGPDRRPRRDRAARRGCVRRLDALLYRPRAPHPMETARWPRARRGHAGAALS